MPFGIVDSRWKLLPLEDQIEIARLNNVFDYQIMTDVYGTRFLQIAGEETTQSTTSSSTAPPGGGGGAGGAGGGSGTPPPPSTPMEQTPVAQNPLMLYGGGLWVQITDPTGTEASSKWVVFYTLPGGQTVYFEATPDQMKAIFGPVSQPQQFSTISQSSLDSTEGLFFGGNVAEVETQQPENFITAYERAVAAGLGTGVVPEELRGNVEIESLIFLAEHEDWSTDRLFEELAKTQAFRARFPQIDVFRKQGLNVQQAVQGYREYENMVNALNLQYEGREATSDEITSLIARQHSPQLIQSTYEVFERFETNEKALAAFNEVLQFSGRPVLSEDDMFNFLAGEGAPELYDFYAQAALREASVSAGLGDVADLSDIRTIQGLLGDDIDFGRAYEGMTQAARLILQYRHEIDLGELEMDDLVDINLGIAPRSGNTQAAVARSMERALASARAFLNRRTRRGDLSRLATQSTL